MEAEKPTFSVEALPYGGPGGERVVYRGVWVPAGAWIRATGGDLPWDVRYRLGVLPEPAPRLVITELHVIPSADNAVVEIQSHALRQIKVPVLLAGAVDAVLRQYAKDGIQPADAIATDLRRMFDHPKKQPGQGRVLSDEQLEEVAAVARSHPGRTTSAVQRHFTEQGIPIGRSTAGDYIKRAREAGLLKGI